MSSPLVVSQSDKLTEPKVHEQRVFAEKDEQTKYDSKDQSYLSHLNIETQHKIPPKHFSNYKSERAFSSTNLWSCKDNICNKIIEFFVSPKNKFSCTEKNIEIWYKYKNYNNQINERLGFLTMNNNISDVQDEGKCLNIKKYSK